MSSDRELADLLGEAPAAGPDPAFRFEVFARAAERVRRRAAVRRAANWTAGCAALGLLAGAAQAAGPSLAAAQPLLLAAGVLALAGAIAVLTIAGPRAVLARSRAALGRPLLRA